MNYNHLQLREIFHLEFLRWFGKKINPSYYVLKGGVNLRFFYGSFRYSEDMDLDVRVIQVNILRDKVMQILDSNSFQNSLQPFGIMKIISPNIDKAKQTQSTQRFKIHLIISSGEDLFTKIEFSRRGFNNSIKIETISSSILREYKLAPLLVPHYSVDSVISQKVDALAKRTITQARDVFDIYILISQIESIDKKKIKIDENIIKKAIENTLEIGFEQFKNTVVYYLSKEDQKIYELPSVWDDIKSKVIKFIEELL